MLRAQRLRSAFAAAAAWRAGRRAYSQGKRVHVILNHRVRGLKPSATLRVNELSNEMIENGRDIVKLGLGQSPFPVPEAMQRALRDNAHQKDYLPVKGLFKLRQQVARYTSQTIGIPRTADDVLIGPGSKELLFLLQLVNHGELLLPNPSWVSYAPQAKIIDRNIHWLETTMKAGWTLRPEVLRRHLESGAEGEDISRVLLLNSPSNPTGRAHTRSEIKLLAEVCREHGVIVLSDEIYGETHLDGEHVSIAEYYPEGTIVSHGISKGFGAGGWRLGAHIFPPQLRRLLDAMAVVASETYTSVSAPIQHAACAAYEYPDSVAAYVHDSRRVLKALGLWSAHTLREAGVEVLDPMGGFYCLPSWDRHRDALATRGISTSDELVESCLRDAGVAFLPGSDFGRPATELTARLAFVDFSGELALQGVPSLPDGAEGSPAESEEWLREHCPRVVSGIERLCEWTKAL